MTTGVNEFFAVSSFGVEPPSIGIGATVTLFTGELAHILGPRTTDTSEGGGTGGGFAGVGGGAAVGTVAGRGAFHVAFTTRILEGFTGGAKN